MSAKKEEALATTLLLSPSLVTSFGSSFFFLSTENAFELFLLFSLHLLQCPVGFRKGCLDFAVSFLYYRPALLFVKAVAQSILAFLHTLLLLRPYLFMARAP